MAVKRFEFDEIFTTLTDGSLETKVPLDVGQILFGKGTKFEKGVVYGGIDFHLYKNGAIAVDLEENSEGPLKIIGFYSE